MQINRNKEINWAKSLEQFEKDAHRKYGVYLLKILAALPASTVLFIVASLSLPAGAAAGVLVYLCIYTSMRRLTYRVVQ